MPTASTWWSDLSADPPPYGELFAHRVHTSPDVFLAIDHTATPHLLLSLPKDDNFTDDQSRGIQVTAHRLRVEERPEAPFLDVRSTDEKSRELFRLVTGEMIDAVEAGMPPMTAVVAVLGRWRHFWGDVPEEGLSPDQVRGLFGELWFLAVWLSPLGAEHVLHWLGPQGARHDFQWPALAVEAKATTSVRGHVHRINGIDQLSPPDKGTLYFFSLRMRDERSASNSVITLIERIHQLLEKDQALLDRFDATLARAGYSPLHIERYRDMRFFVVDERLYKVAKGFPMLTPASFAGGVPTGIERIDYDVNLETVGALCVARKPTAIPKELRGAIHH
jgi:hypothetical protein